MRLWRLIGGSMPGGMMHSGPSLKAMEQVDALDGGELREYLDDTITKWRERAAVTEGEDALIARCYIDAYQSVRTSVFGETLP